MQNDSFIKYKFEIIFGFQNSHARSCLKMFENQADKDIGSSFIQLGQYSRMSAERNTKSGNTVKNQQLMKVYNLEALPTNPCDTIKLTPTSSYILQSAHVMLKQLLPAIGTPGKANDSQPRRNKKLQILKSLRRKLLENEYDLHMPSPHPRHRGRSGQKKKIASRNWQADPHDRQRKKRRSKYNSKRSGCQTKSTSREIEFRFLRDIDFIEEGMTRQRSQKVLCCQKMKKSVDNDRFVSATRILYSKQIVKEIDLEKEREERRQAELDVVEGLEAHRLQKIHAIQRMKAQQKLDHLKKLQDSYLEALVIRQSL